MDGQVKYGLWGQGRHIKWFSSTDIDDIKNQNIDYRIFYWDQEDKEENQLVDFKKPIEFDN